MGFKRGLGDTASSMIVAALTYNTTAPTVDSQVVSLKAAGADVFLMATIPKFSAQAIRKAHDIDWHPLKIVVGIGSSIAGAIRRAGLVAAKGVISAAYQKDPADPQWHDDPDMKAWNTWMDTAFSWRMRSTPIKTSPRHRRLPAPLAASRRLDLRQTSRSLESHAAIVPSFSQVAQARPNAARLNFMSRC